MNKHHSNIAVVTGGSRGLGRSTVLSLARRGVASIFTYHTNRAEAEQVVALAAQAGPQPIALQLDTGKAGSFDAFVREVQAALQTMGATRFDYLVNNAAVAHHAALELTTEAELDHIYNVNFKGPFFLTQKLLPLIHDGGRILNISSGLTRFTIANIGPYAALKGALEVLTRYQAKELGVRGISANSVAPGAIETDFGGGMVRDNREMNQMVAGMTALGRAGLPDDIGPMVAALLSDDNRWINGQRIEVSGGMNL